MKKLFLVIAVVALTVITSCNKAPKAVSATVTIDDSELVGIPVPDSYKVTLTNTTTSETFTADSENKSASFVLTPGIYNVLIEGQSNKDGVAYTIAGSGKLNAVEDGAAVEVKVNAAKTTQLIFKEMYYTGCGDWYFRDQYYEIYNNSDQVAYADKLCIADLDMFNWDGTPLEYDIENPEKYVFSQFIWQIPGDGDDYPIAPGESFVIAQWATNHSIESLGGAQAKDLTGAEFEAILGESTLWNGTVITDNAAVNMQQFAAAYSMPQWLTSVSGSTMVIFYPPADLEQAMTYQVGSDSDTSGAQAIPLDCILDAVHCCESSTEAAMMSIPAEYDAGYVCCSGIYVNESIVRKVAETKDGRVVYKDTNNSSSDFEVTTEPKIRRNGEGVPSWNTWK